MKYNYKTVTDFNILNKLAKILWELPLADKQTIEKTIANPKECPRQEKACYFRTAYIFELGRKDKCYGSPLDNNQQYCSDYGEKIDEVEVVLYANSYKEAVELLMKKLCIDKEKAKKINFYTKLQVREDVLEKLNP